MVLPARISLASLGFGGPRSMVELRERKVVRIPSHCSRTSAMARPYDTLSPYPQKMAPKIAVAPVASGTSLNYLGKIGVPGENSAHDLSLRRRPLW